MKSLEANKRVRPLGRSKILADRGNGLTVHGVYCRVKDVAYLYLNVHNFHVVRLERWNAMNDKWEFYKDNQGLWRWRRTAPNGKVVGTSSEGYKNRADCEANARRNGWRG